MIFLDRYLTPMLGALILTLVVYAGYQHIQHLKSEADNVRLESDLSAERSNLETARAALKASQIALDAANAALNQHAGQLEELRRNQEATNAQLEKAISEHSEWSDTPLPPGVRDALRKGD